MSIRTPLSQVKYLGSAKEGSNHWWWQRLTAVMLIPLSLWFVSSIIWLVTSGAKYNDLQEWMSGPVAAILMILLLGSMFFHIKLGIQVVIEDYVHNKAIKWTLIIALNIGCLIGAIAAIYSTIVIALGS